MMYSFEIFETLKILEWLREQLIDIGPVFITLGILLGIHITANHKRNK